jgi:hypothetical protein
MLKELRMRDIVFNLSTHQMRHICNLTFPCLHPSHHNHSRRQLPARNAVFFLRRILVQLIVSTQNTHKARSFLFKRGRLEFEHWANLSTGSVREMRYTFWDTGGDAELRWHAVLRRVRGTMYGLHLHPHRHSCGTWCRGGLAPTKVHQILPPVE